MREKFIIPSIYRKREMKRGINENLYISRIHYKGMKETFYRLHVECLNDYYNYIHNVTIMIAIYRDIH